MNAERITYILLVLMFSGGVFLYFESHFIRRVYCPKNTNFDQPQSSKKIFFITPTYERITQRPDLLRVVNSLRNANNLLWLVVEDAVEKSPYLQEYLKTTGLNYVFLNAKFTGPNPQSHRGVAQRNIALDYITDHFCHNSTALEDGVVYFGDDDNSYDFRLFDVLSKVNKLAIFPVGCITGVINPAIEGPKVERRWKKGEYKDKIVGFDSIHHWNRHYWVDMAGFAFGLSELCKNPNLRFQMTWGKGTLEDMFLKLLNPVKELQNIEVVTKDVFVFHTRTERPESTKYSPSWTTEFKEIIETHE